MCGRVVMMVARRRLVVPKDFDWVFDGTQWQGGSALCPCETQATLGAGI